MRDRVDRAVLPDVHIVVNIAGIVPNDIGICVQFDQAVTVDPMLHAMKGDEQVPVGREMAVEKAHQIILDGSANVRRSGPNLAEGDSPVVYDFAAHIDEKSL